ncbi:MAG: hypothetical protein A3B30_01955 [Candidatus Komeilibacteria bacterium RIFCSPLOWO2_01_FULL_52_15]|uniref:Ribulose-phosphate 3-epimerase n=2 Tax=Candidatus Komeiliibacteriota TaxID=1817908 RepID=A0A1G2BSG0_9BACT|nr:MAG: hypothetical protein A2677_01205 [Candidatus Komeilibacteria bacterium RIFCSPHIGHO2_01_FULL_52_14]OGY92083.1 MAG: hypothetical protein A3B30_01955 [Candidatus Komeilibacteria bacterium RIFCSPLOWO2_01_FULL_52_15]
MTYVVPTILVKNEHEFRRRVAAIGTYFNRAQIDVLDNTFVPAESFRDVRAIEYIRGDLQYEIDLMTRIDGYDLAQWNKPWVDKIIIHVEATAQADAVLKQIRAWGKRAFLSVNPDTSFTAMERYLPNADGVLFMTVKPGRSGNLFQPQVLDAIQAFRKKHPTVEIEVDGGVTLETMQSLLSVGVNGFAVGSFLDNEKMEEHALELVAAIEQFEQKNQQRKR